MKGLEELSSIPSYVQWKQILLKYPDQDQLQYQLGEYYLEAGDEIRATTLFMALIARQSESSKILCQAAQRCITSYEVGRSENSSFNTEQYHEHVCLRLLELSEGKSLNIDLPSECPRMIHREDVDLSQTQRETKPSRADCGIRRLGLSTIKEPDQGTQPSGSATDSIQFLPNPRSYLFIPEVHS